MTNEWTKGRIAYTRLQVQRLGPVVAQLALEHRHEERVAAAWRRERGQCAEERFDAVVAVQRGRLVDGVQKHVVRT